MDESDNLSKSYVWGIDISGSEQGAGGVGGLLMASDGSVIHFPAYDGNGNITAYTDGSSALAASYEYSPFGALTASSGSTFSPFRFSTKCYNTLTGLYYYGFRYYSPRFARWINRDPIGERGGINLYAMVGNDAVNKWDKLGNYEVCKDKINCIGHASGIGSALFPGKDSLASTFKKLGWVCKKSKSANCKCDCDHESTMMVYVYIKKFGKTRWSKLSDEQKQREIDATKKRHKGKDFWNDVYWAREEKKKVKIPRGFYMKKETVRDDYRLDYHGIKRNCSEKDGSEKSWEYVGNRRPKNSDGTYSVDGYLKDADDYWKNNSPERVVSSMCCKKKRKNN